MGLERRLLERLREAGWDAPPPFVRRGRGAKTGGMEMLEDAVKTVEEAVSLKVSDGSHSAGYQYLANFGYLMIRLSPRKVLFIKCHCFA